MITNRILRQKGRRFDTDLTLHFIKEYKKSVKEDKEDYTKEDYEEIKDWLKTLKRHAHDQIEYEYHAFREKPDFINFEDVPYGQVVDHQLNIVMDAFDEICMRLEEKDNKHGYASEN